MANNKMRPKATLNKIKAVMGWDIGDGDSVAFIKYIIGGKEVSQPLYLHRSRDEQVVKSAVAINSSGVITIGEDAAKQQDFAINFKCAPESWDYQYVMGLTYRQHMFNYIRGVSEAILQNSSNRSTLRDIITKDEKGNMYWKKDEVLLVVGCPASIVWKGEKMREQYEKLISEATGISNVIVTEESRAAVFSLFEIDDIRGKINLQAGVLVLDFGSSTADATYILPGKKVVNISWKLGAAQVENAMLAYLLQSSKTEKLLTKLAKMYGKKRVLVVRNDCTHAVFQLRLDKEDYFDGKLGEDAALKNVSIPIMDEDGDRLFDEDGEPVEPPVINYRVTAEMMQYAVDEYEFDAQKDAVIVNRGTWKENCQQFLNDVKLTLEKEKLPVQAVVVTGGGSQMPFVVELSSEAFPEKVIPSDTPSHSVVKGLATIAYNEVKAPEVHDKAMKDIESKAAKNISAMIESIADNLADKAYDAAVDAVDWLIWYDDDTLGNWILSYFNYFETNVGDITRAVKNAISNSLENNVRPQIDNSTKIWMDKDNEVIVGRINEAAKDLYADQAMRDMVRISQADVEAISKNVFLPNISMPNVAKDANFIGKIVGYILSAVLVVVLSFLAISVPVLAPVFAVIGLFAGAALIEKLKEWESCPVSDASLRKAVRKMKENKNKKMKEIKEPLHQALREAFTKPDVYGKDFENHYMVLMETAEMAFNKILLKTEDDQ